MQKRRRPTLPLTGEGRGSGGWDRLQGLRMLAGGWLHSVHLQEASKGSVFTKLTSSERQQPNDCPKPWSLLLVAKAITLLQPPRHPAPPQDTVTKENSIWVTYRAGSGAGSGQSPPTAYKPRQQQWPSVRRRAPGCLRTAGCKMSAERGERETVSRIPHGLIVTDSHSVPLLVHPSALGRGWDRLGTWQHHYSQHQE